MQFGIVGKLLKLLSPENVRYLDVLLKALTVKEGSPVYTPLWNWFGTQFPNNKDAMAQAWKALSMLRSIVSEYRTNKGI